MIQNNFFQLQRSRQEVNIMNLGSESMEGVQLKIHLGNRIFVIVMADKTIDIRQWCNSREKGSHATNLGIHLTPENWMKLLGANEHLVADIKHVMDKRRVNKFYPVGDGIYASIRSPNWLVDVRLWCDGEDGLLRPGWKGIRLNFVLWRRLMFFADNITAAIKKPQEAVINKS